MFFKCATHAPHADHAAGKQVSNGLKSLVVDIHCHAELQEIKSKTQEAAEKIGRLALAFGSQITKETNQQQLKDLAPKFSDLNERLADMDAAGIDIQAVSVPPYQFCYWTDSETGREISRQSNELLIELQSKNPDRLCPLGTVPLQNTEMAVAELEYCVKELGMKGVAISTNVNGEELSSPRLDPFFAKAVELDVLIFVHPEGFTQPDRLTEHYFINLLGHPMETSIAISHLIFDGTLERHSGLKICFAHGGGFLPAYAGRMDHAFPLRPDCQTKISKLPGEYMQQLFFDTVVFEPDQLSHLINRYGSDHILLGTDFPYDMGETDPLGLVGKVDGLSEDDVASVCGLNAARLLKLDA
ncbi:MAG: amidohydrolase [Rhodospirillaceae bacterium]|jgi:aminocarboxymuconate-semialdehyde decarboxylase|nr:amidohydrolase [Rhodospirillales bacterium]MBT3904990.1 amidohydrolase [Rhodospirillaceae bacterium]MBT4703686.1 amidohydrolase [Rhodospirillaceae bacterium]MBT5034698.1 amidohydrolase [Rhodospirillaceae bacterium]MBT6220620.1 amidohydrolase [Rhodospirillaceae bacterium]